MSMGDMITRLFLRVVFMGGCDVALHPGDSYDRNILHHYNDEKPISSMVRSNKVSTINRTHLHDKALWTLLLVSNIFPRCIHVVQIELGCRTVFMTIAR